METFLSPKAKMKFVGQTDSLIRTLVIASGVIMAGPYNTEEKSSLFFKTLLILSSL